MIVKDARCPEPAGTDAEMIERAYKVFELVVNGATTGQICKTLGMSRDLVRSDYRAVVEELNRRGADRAIEIREEILARQRMLIFHNLPMAKLGDGSKASRNAAAIVQKAEDIIASVTGVRYIRIEVDTPPPPVDTTLAEAIEAYTVGITDAARTH